MHVSHIYESARVCACLCGNFVFLFTRGINAEISSVTRDELKTTDGFIMDTKLAVESKFEHKKERYYCIP